MLCNHHSLFEYFQLLGIGSTKEQWNKMAHPVSILSQSFIKTKWKFPLEIKQFFIFKYSSGFNSLLQLICQVIISQTGWLIHCWPYISTLKPSSNLSSVFIHVWEDVFRSQLFLSSLHHPFLFVSFPQAAFQPNTKRLL